MENGESVDSVELIKVLDIQDHIFFKLTYLMESHTGYLNYINQDYKCFDDGEITGFYFLFEELLNTLKSNAVTIEEKARQCKK
jgi:hypothetical protein